MTIKPDKDGLVTGTNNADLITWISSTDWKRALTVNARAGNDTIDFRNSIYKNKLSGEAGNDTIYGGYNNDSIAGGKGNDKIYGKGGTNKIYFYSGDGKDLVYSTKNAKDTLCFTKTDFSKLYFKQNGKDLIISGYGGSSDYLTVVGYYSGQYTSIKTIQTKDKKLSVADAITESAEIHRTKLTGKHITGTNGNDTLKGTNKNDIIHGKLGADKIYGYGGNDVLEAYIDAYIDGGDGDDYIRVEQGFSKLKGGNGNDRIYAGGPHNKVYAGNGNDYVHCDYAGYVNAGKGNDIIYLSGDSNIYEQTTAYGGKGNDDITVSSSYSIVYCGCNDKDTPSGNDKITLNSNSQFNTIYAEDGDNTIKFAGSFNKIYAGNGNNTIEDNTDGNNNTIILGNSNNYITLDNTGTDTIIKTGFGDDVLNLNSRSQRYSIYLGKGNDTVYIDDYNVIDNTIYGQGGNDTYYVSFSAYTPTYQSENTIYDNSGDNDSIYFMNSWDTKSNLKMYVNVFNDGTYDNDLIIYDDYNDSLTVQNYLTDGKVENVNTSDNYHVSDAVINSAIQQVASWLSTNDYYSVEQVLDNGSSTDINAVISKFTTAWVK